MAARPHVGTLGEKPLHAALKRWYSQDGDRIEEPIDGFVIDIVRDDLLIEIQTRGFSSMKRKLKVLLEDHAVCIVHPIASEKWIVKIDDTGEILSRRKSPKRGSFIDIFSELVSFPELASHPNLTLDVLLVQQDEIRRHDPTKAWRRKGWVIEERHLVDIVDRLMLHSPAALSSLLPEDLPDEFTTAELAAGLGRERRIAQQMAYCLREMAVIGQVGKRGNAIVYRMA